MFVNTLIRKFKTLIHDPKLAIGSKFLKYENAYAMNYLEKNGLLELLAVGKDSEIPMDAYDLYTLHSLVRKRKPMQIIELGSGFSTLVLARALRENHVESNSNDSNHGIIYSLDASKQWLENTRNKIPRELHPYVDLRYSPVEICLVEGELCHKYTSLPNIIPDFFYLDGPDPKSIQGKINGLGFVHETGKTIPPVSADPMLYESRIKPGFFMVIDARNHTLQFLERHMKRKYKRKWNRHHKFFTLELIK